MTDNEIIKALECCVNGECEECCFDEQTACKEYLLHAALDLIKRQQAEIERLEKVKTLGDDLIEQLRITVNNRTEENKSLELDLAAMRCAANSYKLHYGNLRMEIVREFADRLKETVTYFEDECGEFVPWVDCRDIDNLVKEMTEDV